MIIVFNNNFVSGDLELKSMLLIEPIVSNNIPCFHSLLDLLNGCVDVSFIRHPFIIPLSISEFVKYAPRRKHVSGVKLFNGNVS